MSIQVQVHMSAAGWVTASIDIASVAMVLDLRSGGPDGAQSFIVLKHGAELWTRSQYTWLVGRVFRS